MEIQILSKKLLPPYSSPSTDPSHHRFMKISALDQFQFPIYVGFILFYQLNKLHNGIYDKTHIEEQQQKIIKHLEISL